MTSRFHSNEAFLHSLSTEQLELIKQEAANSSTVHEAALNEQLERLNIK